MKRNVEGGVKPKEAEARSKGVCPHNLRKCDRARLCGLGVAESRDRLIQNKVHSCADCRRKRTGPCRESHKCFREGRII